RHRGACQVWQRGACQVRCRGACQVRCRGACQVRCRGACQVSDTPTRRPMPATIAHGVSDTFRHQPQPPPQGDIIRSPIPHPRLMPRPLRSILCTCALLLASPAPYAQAEPQLLHTEPSQFGKILVFEENGERCLNFNSMVDFGRQTCMSLAEPDTLVFRYTRMMVSP